MTVAIPDPLRDAMYAHAIAAFPAECCGYLTGPAPDAADTIVRCTNAQASGAHPLTPDRGPDTGFVITGAELFAFARSFDGPSPARVVYHSHTNGRAYLSGVDQTLAETPDGPAYPVEHVVIAVAIDAASAGAPRIVEVAQFAWKEHDRSYVEVARWCPPAGREAP